MYKIEINGEELRKSPTDLKNEIRKAGYQFPLTINYVESLTREERTPEGKMQIIQPKAIQIDLVGYKALTTKNDRGAKGDPVIVYQNKTIDPVTRVPHYRGSSLRIEGAHTVTDPEVAWFVVFCSPDVEGNELVEGSDSRIIKIYDSQKEARKVLAREKVLAGLKSYALVDSDSDKVDIDFARDMAAMLAITGTKDKSPEEIAVALGTRFKDMSNHELENFAEKIKGKGGQVKIHALVQQLFDAGIVRMTQGKDVNHIVSSDENGMDRPVLNNVEKHKDIKDEFANFLMDNPDTLKEMKSRIDLVN